MSKENLKNKNHTSHFALHTSKQNGITLIALIITIIVMLILTGVTLSITLGDNGLVNKAKEATEATEVAMDRELLLSAVVGTIDNNGKVNLGAIVLPEGFTGSNGTYTSKNGNTFTVSENGEIVYTGSNGGTGDNIIENGGEVETFSLDGKYISDLMGDFEIKDNEIIFSEDWYSKAEVAIDYSTKTGNIVVEDEYESHEIKFVFEPIIENNQVINIVLISEEFDGEEFYYIVAIQNKEGFEYDLEGDYVSEDGYNKITFKASEPDWDSIDDYMSYTSNMHEYSKSGDSWVIVTSGGTERVYFKINNKYFLEYETAIVSDDKNTITWQGETYTKQTAD